MILKKNTNSLYGVNPLIEAIRSGKTIDKLFVQKGLRGPNYQKIIELVKKHNISIHWVPAKKLNRLTRKNHQGVFAFLSPIDFYRIGDLLPSLYEQGKSPLLLILDRITDVGNFGAIVRTAASTGVDAVIIPMRHAASISADAVKASAGALFKIPICKENDLKKSIEFLKISGIRILAATEKAEHFTYTEDFTIPSAIILGSEQAGLSVDCLRLSDQKLKLPMYGNISSLNVSVACGMILYEALRQRLGKPTK
ncbi:MAG: 23S rRNA (guanosine(2251)-2'-O)-methyltransferase RlmB [Flavobacteriales bacterium AspAUS03]